MKTKGLVFITCLAAGALIASPALGKPEKKSAGTSTSKPKRTSPQTTQVMPGHRYQQNRQNTAARALTMAITPITVAQATMAVDRLTRTTVTTRAGRIPIGVTEHPGDTTRTRTGAVIRTAPITTTRTTHQLTAITRHWSQPCSGASANSVITAA